MSQQFVPAARKANCALGCNKRGEASTVRQVIVPFLGLIWSTASRLESLAVGLDPEESHEEDQKAGALLL